MGDLAGLALAVAGAPNERWVDRMRAGLLALLEFFDSEPRLARLCVIYSAIAGPDAGGRITP